MEAMQRGYVSCMMMCLRSSPTLCVAPLVGRWCGVWCLHVPASPRCRSHSSTSHTMHQHRRVDQHTNVYNASSFLDCKLHRHGCQLCGCSAHGVLSFHHPHVDPLWCTAAPTPSYHHSLTLTLIPTAIKDGIIPHAVEWFTGEIAPPMFDDLGGEYEEEEEEEQYADTRQGGRR